ncbi:hypothetical protein C1H46_041462 [Malus baccata]|uniref:Probable zinc-ribbon domain-containing protein n=1 Tax=Malus baccata TaxID=106549 RepID=A0A540KFS8_MALBA|nr:hypothetical protein C1H46_041462 [Malus baccata]
MDLRRGRGKERVFGDRKVNSISGSSSRTDNKEVMVDNYGNNVRERVNALRFEQRGAAIETEFVEKYSRISQFPIDNWMSGDEIEMNMSRSMSVNSSVGDVSAHLQNFAGSVRAKGSMDQFRGVERDRFDGFYASSRVGAQRGRIPTSAYPDEGPSNYKVDSFDAMSEVENLEQDRAELLRKLDELKQKLSRSYDVVDKPWEPVPMERSRTPPDPYGDRLTYNLSMQPYAVDEQMTRLPYLNYSHGHVPFMGYRNMDTPNFYPPQRHPLNAIPEYEDPSQQQMKRRPPPHLLQYPRPQSHEYFMGQRMEFNSNPHDNTSHSPACSCLGCYNQNRVASPQVSLDDFGNRRVPKAPVSLNTYQQVKPHDYNPRHASPPPLHTRWQSDFDSEPRSAMAVNRRGRIFHPVAGGAPFITCFSCFEVLKLPRKLKNTNNNQSKLRCGSCSTVISLEIKSKKLITSAPKDSKQQSSEVDQSSNEALKGSISSPYGSPNAGDTKSCCNDLDHSDHYLPSIETKDNLLTEALKGSISSLHGSPNAGDIKSRCDDLDHSDHNLPSIETKDNLLTEALKGSISSLHGSPNAGDIKSRCDDLDHSDHNLPSIETKDNLLTEALKGSISSLHGSPNAGDIKSRCDDLDHSDHNLPSIETKDNLLTEALKGSISSLHGSPNAGDIKSRCDDLDHSDHNLPSIETKDNLLTEALKGSISSLHGSPNAGDIKSRCDDLDHSDHNLPSIETKDNLLTEALKGSISSLHGSPNAGDIKSRCDDLDHSDHNLPSIETKDNLLTEALKGSISSLHGSPNAGDIKSRCDDLDHSDHNLPSIETKDNLLTEALKGSISSLHGSPNAVICILVDSFMTVDVLLDRVEKAKRGFGMKVPRMVV